MHGPGGGETPEVLTKAQVEYAECFLEEEDEKDEKEEEGGGGGRRRRRSGERHASRAGRWKRAGDKVGY